MNNEEINYKKDEFDSEEDDFNLSDINKIFEKKDEDEKKS